MTFRKLSFGGFFCPKISRNVTYLHVFRSEPKMIEMYARPSTVWFHVCDAIRGTLV